MSGKLLIIVNSLEYFTSHRLPIALKAGQKGFNVTIAYGELGRSDPKTLEAAGIKTVFISMKRGSLNPFQEIKTLYSVRCLLRNLCPDIVHLVTIKPYLYGGIAARLVNTHAVVSAVTGMGSMFIKKGLYASLFRSLLYPFFCYAFGHKNQAIVIQNRDDQKFLRNWKVTNPEKIYLVRGSGVDLSQFIQADEPRGTPIIVFAARLLIDKGVMEFVSAAKILHAQGINVRFWLIGKIDPGNPSSISEKNLTIWQNEKIVKILGFRNDIPALFSKVHIVCLPSYREGFPKVLIEAAAAGRATVTTDTTGCRDAIIPGKTGILVPVKDPKKLADALQWLLENPLERAAMGRAGRVLAERKFEINKVVDKHIQIYQELLNLC